VNLTDIRAGLMANLATVDGVRVYAEWSDTPNYPAVCIISDDPYIEPYVTFGLSYVHLIVAVIVSKMPDVARAQQNLDALLSSALPAAVRGLDSTLGGAGESVTWRGTSGLREITIQGVGYLGHEMTVEVIAET
jgi:hypothetical protein